MTKGFLISLCLMSFLALAAVDESRLPPPAGITIDFERDIKPIFEATCFRCHGPERPKSNFRLDEREPALKGGENGIDIIPGNSAKSPLVHYVARLVPDMQMPPQGKGKPLTPEQIGLLRAWIDQGAIWSSSSPPVQLVFSAVPVLRSVAVQGDKASFREIEGVKQGFAAGAEHFHLEDQVGADKKVITEGKALFPDNDIQIKLELRQTDIGFVRGGFEQWRRYYDDSGGYYRPFSVPGFELNRDLHLDIGRAWVDFGLTIPDWPRIVVGYEYQFKDGAKSTLEWGNVNGKNIYPASKDINEHVHIAKFDLSHDFSGWHLEDRARVEVYTQKTLQTDASSYTLGPGPDAVVKTREGASHVQGMNTIYLERQVTGSLLVSGGYLYSRFDGDASLNQATVDSAGVPMIGQFWSSDIIVLTREAHVFSLAGLLQPIEGLSGFAGVQSEWERQHGAGNIRLDEGDPNVPDNILPLPASVQSDLDKTKLMENAGLRYTSIPFTVLFAEARFEQEDIGQFEHEDTSSVPTVVGIPDAFLRDTDAHNDKREGRLGFNTSPVLWLALSAHYKNRVSDTDYNHRVDLAGDPLTDVLVPNPGYSAFIRHREIGTDEAEAKLVLRPSSWLRATLTYQIVNTDYSTTTDPVPGGTLPEGLLAGKYDAQIYGIGLTVTPFQRFYFSGTFTYSDSRTSTSHPGNDSIVPYKGDIYSVIASANYSLNEKTEIHCAYSFSQASYGQNNFDALPLGLSYTRHGLMAGISRRLTANLTTALRYGFFRYSEPTSGTLNDYTAHGIFATFAMKWP